MKKKFTISILLAAVLCAGATAAGTDSVRSDAAIVRQTVVSDDFDGDEISDNWTADNGVELDTVYSCMRLRNMNIWQPAIILQAYEVKKEVDCQISFDLSVKTLTGWLGFFVGASSTSVPFYDASSMWMMSADSVSYWENDGANQVENASCIIFSHTDVANEKKLEEALALVKEHNPGATVILTPWDQLSGADILSAMEHKDTLEMELQRLKEEHEKAMAEEEGHHHHHHHDGEEDEEGHHHHHDDEEEEEEDEHHHHHEDEDEDHCCCGHHHHHHADEVFRSWGVQTGKKFEKEHLEACLEFLADEKKYGTVLRAKGVVAAADGGFFHFDYVPGTSDIRRGSAAPVGMLCVIGKDLKDEALNALFGV